MPMEHTGAISTRTEPGPPPLTTETRLTCARSRSSSLGPGVPAGFKWAGTDTCLGIVFLPGDMVEWQERLKVVTDQQPDGSGPRPLETPASRANPGAGYRHITGHKQPM
jgi:hypothetical protein